MNGRDGACDATAAYFQLLHPRVLGLGPGDCPVPAAGGLSDPRADRADRLVQRVHPLMRKIVAYKATIYEKTGIPCCTGFPVQVTLLPRKRSTGPGESPSVATYLHDKAAAADTAAAAAAADLL